MMRKINRVVARFSDFGRAMLILSCLEGKALAYTRLLQVANLNVYKFKPVLDRLVEHGYVDCLKRGEVASTYANSNARVFYTLSYKGQVALVALRPVYRLFVKE